MGQASQFGSDRPSARPSPRTDRSVSALADYVSLWAHRIRKEATDMDLQGKAAIITGGGTGVGRACALAFAERGCDVAVNYSRSADAAAETVAAVEALGVEGVAALTIVNYLLMGGLLISYGISDSLQPVISQNYGARNDRRIAAFLRIAAVTTSIVSAVASSGALVAVTSTWVAVSAFDSTTLASTVKPATTVTPSTFMGRNRFDL